VNRLVPLVLTFTAGFLMMADFFVPHAAFRGVVSELRQWGLIVVAFTYVLGVANVAQVHGRRIGRRDHDWVNSIVLVTSMAAMAGLGIFHSHDDPGSPFIWLFNHVYDPLSSTMFALLAFFITSAAYRAFRARSMEAALLLGAAILVMLGQVPVGAAIWGEDSFLGGFPGIKDWIMSVPNMAAKRAILMGAALGAISTGIRVILGIERAHLGGGR
jgi:predicted permease